ncbi:M48 family metalloprotease [Micromonospora haikouensis]|uniref:M48 family metalloprotease n=1 Tax=Micromonospora haikouensis TaxID=686309 RepID=UPI0037B865F8
MTRPAGTPEAGRDQPPPPQDRDEPPPPEDRDPTTTSQGRDTTPPDDRDTTTPGHDGDGGTPYRLGWLYLLVVAALVAVGIRAGDLLFLANRAWSLPWAAAFAECELAYGATAINPVPPGFTDCMAGPARERGLVMLGAVGVVLAGAALLLLLVPAVDQWRLRRHRGRFAVPGAADRFAVLCDDNGLTGRNRPRLLIAGPPVRQAFTIGVVGRRPLVLLPAGVAVAYRDPARFDPVVQHELAHVRARDVTWVAAVRGLVWLPVPAIAIGVLVEVAFIRMTFPLGDVLPRIASDRTHVPLGGSVLTVLLLAGLVALLAASLLRMREREADRHAARAGQADALAALLSDAPASTAPTGNRVAAALRRPFARHPLPLDRVRSLRQPTGRDGDLAQGLAVGAVTVMAMAAAGNLTRELHYAAQGWLPTAVAAWVGAALLVGGLLPSLLGRAESARRTGVPATWWRPVAGTAIGLFVAAFGTAMLPLPGANGLFLTPGTAYGLLFAAASAALGAGAAGLCVALATVLVGPRPAAGPARAAGRLAGHLVAIAATAVLLWPLPLLAAVLHTDLPEAFRAWLVYSLPKAAWPAALALLALLAARLLPTGPGALRRVAGSMEAQVVALATLVGGTAAILRTQLDPPATIDEALRAAQARWLLCALTGWVVLLATATRPGPRALARGLLAAGSATVLAGFLQYAHSAVTGRSADALALRLAVGTPLVWLLFLTALTSAVLLLRPTRAAPPDGTPARTAPPDSTPAHAAPPGRVPEPPDRPALPGRLVVPATGLVIGLLAGVVLGPGVPGSYAPVPLPAALPSAQPDGTGTAAPVGSPGPGAGGTIPAAPTTTTDPARTGPPTVGTSAEAGRLLTGTEARKVARAVRSALPRSWVSEEAGPATESRIEPAACRPLARDAYLDGLKPGERAAAEARYSTPPGQVGIASTTAKVTVASYAEPVPASVFAAAEADRAACRRFTGSNDDGPPVRFAVRARPAPAVGEQSWRVDYGLSVGSGVNEITGSSAFVMVRVGHNLVTLTVTSVSRPLDERLVADALTAVARALDRP